ncbi:MAG: hypothetical protein F6J90_19555 [Moorea sp. SIOASIH]|uniref:helicase-related protein n=1 Tax=Moorena sp. SIOASIH TaxID=2607817 RepID=UPI0013BDF95B|nr:helicase-related protein [Moorena sp. SIOASIH]NEO38412.1 hypothetical protein [Moorena sp. SIOASIH]
MVTSPALPAKQLIPNTTIVKVHASTRPEYCPQCNSPFFIKSNKDANCNKCNKSFIASKSKKHSNWNRQLQQTQEAFQNNQFPLLIATKGYGMGIDKRNIRFIIHHALASSLEAYYQEAGRAGRDSKHSHVALMYLPPHQECKEKHIYAGELEPPCVSNGQHYIRHYCKYYKNHLCDYGLQAHFIKDDYRGIEKDTNRVIKIYRHLESKETITFKNDQADNKQQISLYRLQQLGVVKEYSKHYSKGFSGWYEVDYNADWSIKEIANKLK